jgi:hypothetical protein|tara:strand:+ start:19267 stop:19668 length:402 start_codon:yes stop_codon:yes gene_type:complete
MTVNIALIIALVASVGINIFGFWYVRDILGRLTWISQNIDDIARIVEIHVGHLKAIHRLEQFYGDQELTGLIEHTQATIELLEDYQTAVLVLEPTEEGMEETSNQKDNNHDEEETEEGIEKDVLYAGTRRRNS